MKHSDGHLNGDAYFFLELACVPEIWSSNLVIHLWPGSWEEILKHIYQWVFLFFGICCGSIPSQYFIRGPEKRSIPQALWVHVFESHRGIWKLSAWGHFVFSRFKDRRTRVTQKWRMRQKILFHLRRSQFGWMKKTKMRKCKLPNFPSRIRLDTSKIVCRFEKSSLYKYVITRRFEKYWRV